MFSERELAIIKVIGRKKMTIKEITTVFWKGHFGMDCEIAIGNSIRRIIKKCEHYRLNWTLTKNRDGGKLFIKKEKV